MALHLQPVDRHPLHELPLPERLAQIERILAALEANHQAMTYEEVSYSLRRARLEIDVGREEVGELLESLRPKTAREVMQYVQPRVSRFAQWYRDHEPPFEEVGP